jgi:hypothetical protein
LRQALNAGHAHYRFYERMSLVYARKFVSSGLEESGEKLVRLRRSSDAAETAALGRVYYCLYTE